MGHERESRKFCDVIGACPAYAYRPTIVSISKTARDQNATVT